MRKESGRYSRRMVSVSELDCLSSKDTVEKLFPVSFISLVCIGSGMHLFSQTRAEVYCFSSPFPDTLWWHRARQKKIVLSHGSQIKVIEQSSPMATSLQLASTHLACHPLICFISI